MARFVAVDPAQATDQAKELLDQVQGQLGITPNMMRTMANSPAVLQGYLSFSGALAGGELSAQLREQIALAVAEANSCEYCASAHTAIGKMVGLEDNDISTSRLSLSDDVKVDAALKFARTIVVSQGEASDEQINRLRQVGYSDAQIIEIIANVVLNIFTNYFNNIAQTVVDFPKIEFSSKKVGIN